MNPFDKYLSKEQVLQSQVCQWLSLQHPKAVWYHYMAEGKRSDFEQYLWKKMGARSGVPDFLIFNSVKNINKENGLPIYYSGLAIELKVKYENGRKNIPTENQIAFMKLLSSCGWKCVICYSFEETTRIINEYLL